MYKNNFTKIIFLNREAVFEIVKELSRYGDSDEGKQEELAQQCKAEGTKVSPVIHIYSHIL